MTLDCRHLDRIALSSLWYVRENLQRIRKVLSTSRVLSTGVFLCRVEEPAHSRGSSLMNVAKGARIAPDKAHISRSGALCAPLTFFLWHCTHRNALELLTSDHVGISISFCGHRRSLDSKSIYSLVAPPVPAFFLGLGNVGVHLSTAATLAQAETHAFCEPSGIEHRASSIT